ncbi:MAG: phosphate transport system regulatory protein PhoU [Nitrospinae bacterium RIFCSPLOWO2_12_FULL_45_22]|nr:MAG: phosphate transport system regulatory protein PhoU [Nitrospinae bacterium RIFCSPLOWO2_12_FULL_45_22]
MARESFHEALEGLQKEVIDMGMLVDQAIDDAIQALKTRDISWSQRIVEGDIEINKMRFRIEERCLSLLATQQPMARDLRTIAAVLSIITDLERMADHAEGIARINIMMGDEPLLKPLIDIPRMAQKARQMLGQSLQAFINRDIRKAKDLCEEDDEIDELYNQVYRELLTFMLQDPKTITRATYLLWVAHNLERIGDRVTNICERTVFMVTGELEEIKVSKY